MANEERINTTNILPVDSTRTTNITERQVLLLIKTIVDLKNKEAELFVEYKLVAFIFGTVIFLSNLTVVISSGLIIKKGQQPRSTYLLLGNMSLADTMVGLSIVFGTIVDNESTYNLMCIFQLGTLVCPTLVSIFSVGLIAVDRYIYILHGMYYQRWCSTTRVRIGIILTWLIGLTLGFLPASGWTNAELMHSRCYYVTLYPGALILLNSLLSIIPIGLVGVLYSIILVRALRNLNEIKRANKSINYNHNMPTVKKYRGNVIRSQTIRDKTIYQKKLERSASLDGNMMRKHYVTNKMTNCRSRSCGNGVDDKKTTSLDAGDKRVASNYVSSFSIQTISSTGRDPSDSFKRKSVKHVMSKLKEPTKWRAIVIVMLTSGCFICTWMPFFIIAIFFVFCQEKLTNQKCIDLQAMLGGPVATLAFLNSVFNPLIYAWWHKGFNGITQTYIRRWFNRLFKKNVFS